MYVCIVEEVRNYSMNLLKIFMSLLLVSRFVRSSDDIYIYIYIYIYNIYIYIYNTMTSQMQYLKYLFMVVQRTKKQQLCKKN